MTDGGVLPSHGLETLPTGAVRAIRREATIPQCASCRVEEAAATLGLQNSSRRRVAQQKLDFSSGEP